MDISTVVGGVASVVGTLLALLDRRDRHQPQPRPHQQAPTAPLPPISQLKPRPAELRTAPLAWGPAAAPTDWTRAAIAWQSAAAYLLGAPGGLLMLLLSRRPEVRYHALQSIGITALSMGYAILASVPYVISVYWTIGYPSFTLPYHDSVHNVLVGGLIAVELLPRFYCAVRVAFGWPARIPLVWRLAASIVQRR